MGSEQTRVGVHEHFKKLKNLPADGGQKGRRAEGGVGKLTGR